jgi:hypothetical protein
MKKLSVASTYTTVGGGEVPTAINMSCTYTNGGSTYESYINTFNGLLTLTGSTSWLYEARGMNFYVQNTGTGNVGGMTAAALGVHMAGTANCTNLTGLFSWVSNETAGTSSSTNVYGFNNLITFSGAGAKTATTIYGEKIAMTISGCALTSTTAYGLYIGDISLSTTNYAIYTGAGSVRFGDSVTLADGKDIITGTTTGMKIWSVGGASGQKGAFWGATPIVQPVLATGASKTVDDVITYLQTLGLARQS